ncbi:DUF819 family protein [Microaceticoccus formicicus]|uniref:DUF819 family protein n=1 Tax=Microaceticoccus formicicus TaxID=3118105 RepID=UPI003CCFF84A|nr:DUF819 family protein [Peptoniphilaceae bacterium AMB_02]
MSSFISPDNTWALWSVLAVASATAIYLEQRYDWANKVTGCILALLIALVLSNLNVIPADSPVYDNVWGYVVPLAVPLLLFRANIKKIWKESGRVLIIYLLSGIGTILGGIVAFFLLKNAIPNLSNIAPMFVGTYTGGSVNFVAMSESFKVDGATVSAALVADNLLMALYFFALVAMPAIAFFRNSFRTPLIDRIENSSDKEKDYNKTLAAKYWGAKEISLFDIAANIAIAFTIVTVSTLIANTLSSAIGDSTKVREAMSLFFGNKYLIITTLTMILATIFAPQFEKIQGSQEIGTFLIYLFFTVIGAPASLKLIIRESPLLLLFALIIVLINMIVSIIFGKIFKFSLEEIIIASNANVGGPTTAAAMAVSKGWTELIVPALLVGTLGYVIGNYYGLLVGAFLR